MTVGMFTEPPPPLLRAFLAEAIDDPDVNALIGNRVRGYKPAPKTKAWPGDVRGAGSYIGFATIAVLDAPPHPQLPITFADFAINVYGVTHQNAEEIWHALVKAFHKVGVRTRAGGLGIWQTVMVNGGTQDEDPATKQPMVRGTMRAIATTLSVDTEGS